MMLFSTTSLYSMCTLAKTLPWVGWERNISFVYERSLKRTTIEILVEMAAWFGENSKRRCKHTVLVLIRSWSFDWSQVSFWASAFSLWQKFSSGRLKHSLVCKLCNCQTFCTNPQILTFHNILSIPWDVIFHRPDYRMIRASRLLKWILETFKIKISHLTTLNVYCVFSYW